MKLDDWLTPEQLQKIFDEIYTNLEMLTKQECYLRRAVIFLFMANIGLMITVFNLGKEM